MDLHSTTDEIAGVVEPHVLRCQTNTEVISDSQQGEWKMDAKDTWPVVKFLIAATGLKRRDARRMLTEVSRERWSQLFIQARAWDRDQAAIASKALAGLLGDEQLATLVEATRRAADGSNDSDAEYDAEPAPRKKATRKR